MRLARTVAAETIRYEEAPIPAPEPGRGVVRVRSVTLCGTDAHIWEDDYATELPIVQGHEFSATITRLHPRDEGGPFAVGDDVVVSPFAACGRCYACTIRRPNACAHMSVYGCYDDDGALAEFMLVPLARTRRIPESLPVDLAPLWEPVSISLQAVRRGRAQRGERVLVSGAGPIGLFALLALREAGCSVTVLDTDTERLGIAAGLGAAHTLAVERGFPDVAHRAVLDAWTDGQGPSLVIDATGAPASLATAVDLVAPAGRVVAVGISDRELTLSMRSLPIKEIDLLGSRNSLHLDDALALLDRNQDACRPLITHRFGFDELDGAFRLLRDRTQRVGKIAVDLPAAAPDRSARDATALCARGGRS
ncbi:alcohol dehydrogenase catalytic domain-containing protein [Sinomonas atrocyanea]|uniref:alcohol dehydrogenase catalytic domain-containing protein n=1 Tax=Sinomonas atrocyanea TaxID=37927 RepID=UPI00286404E1|nr:alcohol dehydrogenase catalytic domain-containing protein [Sinomonas atrocyanea]MDR6620425.1 L-gulonate 5-dehydrogenase [Sinomonas atrocyanea]